MRFTQTSLSNNGDDTTIYHFKANADEWGVILDVAIQFRKTLDGGIFELMPLRGRLLNIIRELNSVLPKRKRRELS